MPRFLLDSVSAVALTRSSVWRDDDKWVLRHSQNVAPILAANREAANAYAPGPRPLGLRHVARLPAVVVFQLQQAGLLDWQGRPADERRLLRFLSDPEHRYLRTDNGRRLA